MAELNVVPAETQDAPTPAVFNGDTNYAIAPVEIAEGVPAITKKSEVKLVAFETDDEGNLVIGENGAPVVSRDETGVVELEGKMPDTFPTAGAFLTAMSGLSEIGQFVLRASWPLEYSDELKGAIHWDFKGSSDGTPGQIIASLVPDLEDVLADQSLLRAVVPQGIADNVQRLHRTVLRLLSSTADKAGQVAALDLSPSNVLRAYSILTERKAGAKQRQLFAIAIWTQTVFAFQQRIEESNASGPQLAKLTRFVQELALYREQPEQLLRMVSSHDGITIALIDNMIPESVVKAVNGFCTRLLDAYASIEPDDEGKIVYAPAATKKGKPKRISAKEVRFLVSKRPTTSFASASLDISDDDELIALLSEAPQLATVSQALPKPEAAPEKQPGEGDAGAAPAPA